MKQKIGTIEAIGHLLQNNPYLSQRQYFIKPEMKFSDSRLQGYLQNGSISSSGTYREIPPRYFLGDLISGTYCSRIFSDCDRNDCRLQSPNFPGMYPRNLTCYYAIRQQSIPPNKHALISIRQKNGQLLSVQSIQYAENKHETKLKVITFFPFVFV